MSHILVNQTRKRKLKGMSVYLYSSNLKVFIALLQLLYFRIWHWVKKDLPEHVNPENHLVPKGPALNAKSPLDMFMAHCGEETFELLTLKSNRYWQQVARSRSKIVSIQEMLFLLASASAWALFPDVCIGHQRAEYQLSQI